MNGLTWLNDLMVFLGKWVPRPVLITKGNCGVWFGRRNDIRELTPGLYWYWPIVSAITLVSTRVRTMEVASQLQGREAVSVVVKWRLSEPRKALTYFNDVFSFVEDRVQAALCVSCCGGSENATVAAQTYEVLHHEFGAIDGGVLVLSVSVVQRGPVIAVKNLSDWAVHASSEL